MRISIAAWADATPTGVRALDEAKNNEVVHVPRRELAGLIDPG